MTEDRIKELMTQVGMPDSLSLYTAFKQCINEVTQEFKPWPSRLNGVDPTIRDMLISDSCIKLS